jgi:hypothetical protein
MAARRPSKGHMTWARFIATVESEDRRFLRNDPVLDIDELRQLLRRAYTEGFAEGHKRGSKKEDTHVMIKFLTEVMTEPPPPK